jgi:hypothetical protein
MVSYHFCPINFCKAPGILDLLSQSHEEKVATRKMKFMSIIELEKLLRNEGFRSTN